MDCDEDLIGKGTFTHIAKCDTVVSNLDLDTVTCDFLRSRGRDRTEEKVRREEGEGRDAAMGQ